LRIAIGVYFDWFYEDLSGGANMFHHNGHGANALPRHPNDFPNAIRTQTPPVFQEGGSWRHSFWII